MANANGNNENDGAVVAAIERLRGDIRAGFENQTATSERLRGDMQTGFANQTAVSERTNERIDALASGNVNGFARLETRLDEDAVAEIRARP